MRARTGFVAGRGRGSSAIWTGPGAVSPARACAIPAGPAAMPSLGNDPRGEERAAPEPVGREPLALDAGLQPVHEPGDLVRHRVAVGVHRGLRISTRTSALRVGRPARAPPSARRGRVGARPPRRSPRSRRPSRREHEAPSLAAPRRPRRELALPSSPGTSFPFRCHAMRGGGAPSPALASSQTARQLAFMVTSARGSAGRSRGPCSSAGSARTGRRAPDRVRAAPGDARRRGPGFGARSALELPVRQATNTVGVPSPARSYTSGEAGTSVPNSIEGNPASGFPLASTAATVPSDVTTTTSSPPSRSRSATRARRTGAGRRARGTRQLLADGAHGVEHAVRRGEDDVEPAVAVEVRDRGALVDAVARPHRKPGAASRARPTAYSAKSWLATRRSISPSSSRSANTGPAVTANFVASGNPARGRPAGSSTWTLPSSQPTAMERPPAKTEAEAVLVNAADDGGPARQLAAAPLERVQAALLVAHEQARGARRRSTSPNEAPPFARAPSFCGKPGTGAPLQRWSLPEAVATATSGRPSPSMSATAGAPAAGRRQPSAMTSPPATFPSARKADDAVSRGDDHGGRAATPAPMAGARIRPPASRREAREAGGAQDGREQERVHGSRR